MTKNDLLNSNVDLINRAGQILAALPKVTLDVSQVGTVGDGKRTLSVTTHALDRIDVYVDRRPQGSINVSNGTTQIEVPNAGTGVQDIAVHGFKSGTVEVVVQVTP